MIFVYAAGVRFKKKKKREIPYVTQLELSWHAGALQLGQQSGNPRRAPYVTCCESLKGNGRIKDYKEALLDIGIVTWDS